MDAPGGGGGAATRSPRFYTVPLDRRRFLILVGGAAAWAALRPYAGLAEKAGAQLPPLQPWTLPERASGSEMDIARALIGAAVLAPSHWNAQPWRFEVEGAAVRLLADPQRALPAIDPEGRAMRLSLGAALENLLVAARAWGLRPTVDYRPPGGAVAEVTWTAGEVARDRALFHAIVERRTNRDAYDGRGLFGENRAALSGQATDSFRLRWIDDPDRIRAIGQLAHDAVHEQAMDRPGQAERFAWTRFGDDARRTGDGVPADALALSLPARWLASRYLNPHSWLLGQGAGSLAKQARKGVRSAGALVLLSTPERREDSWLAAGQVYERLALKATQLGIAHQPISALVEQERVRAELLAHFGAAGEDPIMFLRLGHADRPRETQRRAVALVASFRKA